MKLDGGQVGSLARLQWKKVGGIYTFKALQHERCVFFFERMNLNT